MIAKRVAWLFKRLEEIGHDFQEAQDTDVRERLADVLNYYFVWDNPLDRREWHFSLYSVEGNDEMSDAVATFLDLAKEAARKEGIEAGHARLAALQDPNIWTPEGQRYDWFIGHSDKPLPNDKPGIPKRR